MPYVRMTVVISAAYHVTNTNNSPDEVCVQQEAEMREDLDEKVRRLLAFAKGPGGTITWSAKPEREPPAEVIKIEEEPKS